MKKRKPHWRSAIEDDGWRFVCEKCSKVIFISGSQMLLRIAEHRNRDPECYECRVTMKKVGTKAKGKKFPR